MVTPSTIELLKVTRIERALARASDQVVQATRPRVRQEGRVGSGRKIRVGTLASLKRAADKEARARSASATTVAAAVVAATGVATGLLLLTAELFDGGGIGRQCTNQIKRSRVGGSQ